MTLLFKIGDDWMTTEVTLWKDLLYLIKVFLLQSQLEKVVSIVYLNIQQISLSVKSIYLILHKLKTDNNHAYFLRMRHKEAHQCS